LLDGGADSHRRRLDVRDGCVGRLFERDRFPRGRLGNELAQQIVVQLVAGLEPLNSPMRLWPSR
jgi:uncharacterized protein (DUF3820 family)